MKRRIFVGIILFATIGIFYSCYNREKSLNLDDLETSSVSRGDIFTVVNASGEVAAENEVLLLCPYSSIVQNIVRLPGNYVKKGDVIISLDPSGIEKKIGNLSDQLEMLNNNLLKLSLSAKTTKIDMDHDMEVKKLRIVSLESELNDLNALIEVGGTSQAKVDKVKQELVLAKKELYRATQKHKIKLQQLNAEENGLNLQFEMKKKQLDEMKGLQKKLLIVSPGKGIILEVRAQKGEIVKENELLVRISEHTRLKIQAEISDKYQNIIRNGGKVFAIVNDSKLEGTIGNIRPLIEDDKIKFEVFLKNPKNSDLRVNKKVDLLVVKEERIDVLRVKKHEAFLNFRNNKCYVVQDGKAVLTDIKTGLSGSEYLEISEGLDSGDVVITTDIPSIKKRNILEIKKK